MSKLLTLKKVCIFLVTALALSGNAKAQGVSKSVVIPVSALPATCKVGGPLYQKISATTGLYMCTATNTLTLVGPGAGIAGPGSSTDNAVVRWDGSAGSTIQNSLVTIDDTGQITTAATARYRFASPGGSLTGFNTFLWTDGTGPKWVDDTLGGALQWNLQSISGSTTRTATWQNSSGTVPYLESAQTWTAANTYSAAIIPSQTVGITGTTAANNASIGAVGEYVTGTTAANTTALTTNTSVNVGAGTNISLTAGDWDCTGVVNFTLAATTSVTNLSGGVSTTTGTLPAQDSYFDFETAANVMTNTKVAAYVCPTVRLSISGTTNVFLVTQATFTASTASAGGTIRCRRVR